MKRLLRNRAFLLLAGWALGMVHAAVQVGLTTGGGTVADLSGPVAHVVVRKSDDTTAFGSAVRVSRSGTWLTAAHTIDDGVLNVWLLGDDGKPREARILWGNYETDTALLAVDDFASPYVETDCRPVQSGQSVTLIGYPGMYNNGPSRFSATVASVDSVRWTALIDGHIEPGMSGAAMVDDFGHLVGMVTKMRSVEVTDSEGRPTSVPTNTGIATLSPAICELLGRDH